MASSEIFRLKNTIIATSALLFLATSPIKALKHQFLQNCYHMSVLIALLLKINKPLLYT
jgi:hypothetical protein